MRKQKINVKDRVEDNKIDLSLSELSEIPVKDIACFKRVIDLDLSNNKIIFLGKNIGLLSHIVKLDLSKNLIKILPDNFGTLKSLRHLDLYNNSLQNLPISFANLNSLRYLDLKVNPLTPALGKIVGPCLTTKDCNEAARNTVKFLKWMRTELENAKDILEKTNAEVESIQRPKKITEFKKKKEKNKLKKSKNLEKEFCHVSNNQKILTINHQCVIRSSNTAFNTILAFFFLLTLNIFAIYIMTAKNSEIIEKLIELIPVEYRDLILSKTENMKIKISDYLRQFRTADEDYSYMKT